MRFLCLGFHDEAAWLALAPDVRQALIDESMVYEAELKASGNCLGGVALQGGAAAATIRFQPGETLVTDGPFAETKEQLGGFMLLEADDLAHAIEIAKRIPCMQMGGSIEVRPINEALSGELAESRATAAV
jgi:hypothetical protein